MTLEDKKNIFIELGLFLEQFKASGNIYNKEVKNNDLFYDNFNDLITLSQSHNGWFTPENVYFSIESWASALTKINIDNWLSHYTINPKAPKIVGLILAGNIPLVGFHDFLSVILSNNKALIKIASKDQHLLPFIIKYLVSINPDFESLVKITEEKLESFDAVIATGSNNTARYFEYYFKGKPSIIRKNRNSVAVLTGNETSDELHQLGIDIFTYFGLGCRNVSKLLVPQGYDFDLFFTGVFGHQDVIKYEKYNNNYDYNKAVYLMSNYKLLDNGFLVLREDNEQYSSPIASLCYEYYSDLDSLNQKLSTDAPQLQCIVANDKVNNSIGFGQTQKPQLNDYADGIDTIEFLTQLG